jgi:hypothetical protein
MLIINIIYGIGETTRDYSTGNPIIKGSVNFGSASSPIINMKNNIIFDTNDWPFVSNSVVPDFSSNNIWYNGGNLIPSTPPAWDSTPITLDPKFQDPSMRDFSLSTGSPAIDAGADASDIVEVDLHGKKRAGGHKNDTRFDIGAFEYYVPPPSVTKN